MCTSLLCRDGCTGIHTHAHTHTHTHTHTLMLTVTWLQSLLSFYLAHPLSPLSSRPTMSTSLSISGTKRIAPATSSFRNYVKKVQFSACNVSHHTVCMHHTNKGSRLTLLGIPLLLFLRLKCLNGLWSGERGCVGVYVVPILISCVCLCVCVCVCVCVACPMDICLCRRVR